MKNARKIKDLLYEQVARIGKVFSSSKRLELIELLCQDCHEDSPGYGIRKSKKNRNP